MPGQHFLIAALIAATVLASAVFWPFLKPLALAVVFAVVLESLYRAVQTAIGNRPSIAAFLTVIIGVFLILLPLSLIGFLVGNEARSLYVSIEQEGGRTFVAELISRAENALPGFNAIFGNISADLDTYAKQVLQWITGNAGQVFSGISHLLISLFVFFIALYYLLRDGKSVRRTIIELSPLSNQEDEEILTRLETAINSTIRGSLTIAFLQGLVSTFGFLIFGVPNAILWGTVTAFAALIPGVGTALVLMPAIAFLFITGASAQALGLLVWGALAVGLIDNLLGPKFIGRGMKLHPLLVLLSVLGGLAFFGPSGIFLGPLSISLLFAILSIYAAQAKSRPS